jgi:hypothetical protein
MKWNSRHWKMSIGMVILGMFLATISMSSQTYAQGSSVDVDKLKQILNATRTALEANDIPGALNQLDMAEGNLTSTANMTNSTS